MEERHRASSSHSECLERDQNIGRGQAALCESDMQHSQAEDQSRSPQPPANRAELNVECVACTDSFSAQEVTFLGCCETVYCQDCLITWMRICKADNDLPKCCGSALDPSDFAILGNDLTEYCEAYLAANEEQKANEEGKPKLYCSSLDCRRFITVSFLRNGSDTSGKY